MLTQMTIKNFALIENLEWQLETGLNILTGETGAGKSIIIDAVGLLVGERSSQEYIRSGCDFTRVEGLFFVERHAEELAAMLEPVGIELAEDHMLLISREIQRNGKSSTRINGRLATINLLKEVGSLFVDIHGQNEHQSIMKAERHLEILDSFIGDPVKKVLKEYRHLYLQLEDNSRKQKEFGGDSKERNRAIELLDYQMKEIDGAGLQVGEETVLEKEKLIITNQEKLVSSIETARQCLYEQEDLPAAMDLIGKAAVALSQAASIDDDCRNMHETCQNLVGTIDDLARDLRNYLGTIEFNIDRATMIESRLDQIYQMKRKYGNTIEQILEYREEAVSKLEKFLNSETLLNQLINEKNSIMNHMGILAEKISHLRREGAERLSNAIMVELADLGMKKLVFQVYISQSDSADGLPISGEQYGYNSKGIDDVEFLLSPNPGEPVKPLVKIASGGEVSRIMLGIKAVLASSDRIPVLIFDEIDAGIGGRAAQAVAQKLRKIARECQVLCVTHLAQIAASADVHFYISKSVLNERTETQIVCLTKEKRVEEIVRMLAGDRRSDAVYKHAQELLDHR